MTGVCKSEHFDFNDVYLYIVIILVHKKVLFHNLFQIKSVPNKVRPEDETSELLDYLGATV